MRIIIAAICLAGSCLPAFAGYGDIITPTQALSRIGQCATVEGRATIVPAIGGRIGMQMTVEDDTNRLTGYINGPAAFPDLMSLDGQTVNLTGVVHMVYGRPEIALNSPDYVWAAGNAPDHLVACKSD